VPEQNGKFNPKERTSFMIYKSLKISLIYVLLSLSVQAEAETLSSFKHDFSLGMEAMRYFYKEPDVQQDEYSRQHGAAWMNHTGYLFGLNGSYRLTWKDNLFIQPEGRILYGKHDYKSGCKEEIYNKTKRNDPALLYETRFLAGGKITLINQLTLSPYTGIGYRFKNDDGEKVKLRDSSTLAYRKSNYVYVPFGAYVDYAINNSWAVSIKGEYDWMIKGWQYTRSTMLTKPATNKQPNGYGLKGEVSISYLYEKLKFSVSPYIHYWNIRNSKELEGGVMEPYNITWESGMKLGISF
jgi:hypothetical protein